MKTIVFINLALGIVNLFFGFTSHGPVNQIIGGVCLFVAGFNLAASIR